MSSPRLKKKLSYEVRKGLHYLFLVFGVVIAFHAPQMHIGFIMGLVTAIYLLDATYCWFVWSFERFEWKV